jgi:phosphoribosylamine--glycine ligase
MEAEGRPFRGCLYFGLMLTPQGPKVIEYNCRFGDPETQALLPLLQGDLLEIMMAAASGGLDRVPVAFSGGASCCVVLASGGYPGAYTAGCPISGLENGELPGSGALAYHAGVRRNEGGGLITAGGRVLGITATAPSLMEAVNKAYRAAGRISFEGMRFRTDIGRRALGI